MRRPAARHPGSGAVVWNPNFWEAESHYLQFDGTTQYGLGTFPVTATDGSALVVKLADWHSGGTAYGPIGLLQSDGPVLRKLLLQAWLPSTNGQAGYAIYNSVGGIISTMPSSYAGADAVSRSMVVHLSIYDDDDGYARFSVDGTNVYADTDSHPHTQARASRFLVGGDGSEYVACRLISCALLYPGASEAARSYTTAMIDNYSNFGVTTREAFPDSVILDYWEASQANHNGTNYGMDGRVSGGNRIVLANMDGADKFSTGIT